MVVKIDVGYNYAGIFDHIVSGSGVVNVTKYNSTTVQIAVTSKPTVTVDVVIDSSQFTTPSSTQYYEVGLWADQGINSTSVGTISMESC